MTQKGYVLDGFFKLCRINTPWITYKNCTFFECIIDNAFSLKECLIQKTSILNDVPLEDCRFNQVYLHHTLSQTTKIEEPIKYNYSVSCPHCSEKIFYLLKHYKKVNAVELEWVMKKIPSGCVGCLDWSEELKECVADPLPEDVNTCFKAKEALYK